MKRDASADFRSPSPPAHDAAALIEGMLDAVWVVDAVDLHICAANAAAGRLMGLDPLRLVGRDVMDVVASPEDSAFWADVANGIGESIHSQTFIPNNQGQAVPVERRVSRARLPNGAPVFIVAMRDRRAECRIEDELDHRVGELSATLEATADGILVVDAHNRIRNFNRRFAQMWGVPAELSARRDDAAIFGWMQRHVVDPSSYERRLAQIQSDCTLEDVEMLTLLNGRVFERVTRAQTARGTPIGRVYSFRDVTERIEAAQRIATLSHTDALTGLANRRVLADRVDFAMALAKREDSGFALLIANLDLFKHINESLGHVLGDRVLVDVAERLKNCLREVDTVARLGGDEFVILLHQADAAGAEVTARRIVDAMLKPFMQGGMSFTLTCSVGVAMYPSDGTSLDALLQGAQRALQQVKQAGRASFRFHQPEPAHTAVDKRSRMTIDHAMRQALANGSFRLHFQPQVDMATGDVHGAEALIRWRDPVLGDVSPGEFIPVAEETGFIVAIGDWVLREAVKQAAKWQSEGLHLTVSVNVSAVQFQQPGFVDGVAEAVHRAGLDPQWLELELTESILIQNAHEALERLRQLDQLGVRLAIDDFGTGYSSLGYLKRFPIRRLKIDRSFVRGLPGDESDVGIVGAIINLARALHMTVIAEGVETAAQRNFLQAAGCDEFQGFLYAPALDVLAFQKRIAALA